MIFMNYILGRRGTTSMLGLGPQDELVFRNAESSRAVKKIITAAMTGVLGFLTPVTAEAQNRRPPQTQHAVPRAPPPAQHAVPRQDWRRFAVDAGSREFQMHVRYERGMP